MEEFPEEPEGFPDVPLTEAEKHERWKARQWNQLVLREPFIGALHAVTQLASLNPTKPRIVVKAMRAGKIPDLTAAALRSYRAPDPLRRGDRAVSI